MTNPEKQPSASSSLRQADGASLLHESPARRNERVPVDDLIRMRAYELYRERDGKTGDELGDWLRAEREYRERSRDEGSREKRLGPLEI